MKNAAARELHARLAKHGIRIFSLQVRGAYGCDSYTLIHGNKSASEWRDDVRAFQDSTKNSLASTDEESDSVYHESELPGRLYEHLLSLGYCDIDDVVADVYECMVAVLDGRVVDDTTEQVDGFGRYGWECGKHPEADANP